MLITTPRHHNMITLITTPSSQHDNTNAYHNTKTSQHGNTNAYHNTKTSQRDNTNAHHNTKTSQRDNTNAYHNTKTYQHNNTNAYHNTKTSQHNNTNACFHWPLQQHCQLLVRFQSAFICATWCLCYATVCIVFYSALSSVPWHNVFLSIISGLIILWSVLHLSCDVLSSMIHFGCVLFLISSHLGFVHPLQDVALHQCLPSSSVCCLPNPGGSLLLCYVILPSSAWSSSRPLPSPWLPLCASPCPPMSFNLAIWPAHFHFCFSVYSWFDRFPRMVSYSFRSNIFLSIALCLRLFVICLFRDHVWQP